MVEIEVDESPTQSFEMFTTQGVEEVGVNLKDLMPGIFGRRKQKQLAVREAREVLLQQEAEKLIDRQKLTEEARGRVEQAGIVFLDEMDKIAGREAGRGPDVSREGVQRDLLPIVEGTTVSTKHGMVKTDHILFIGAGAFHVSRPSDMIPELQGRFPIRVELDALTEEDFVRILTEPEGSLTRQYRELLSTEGLSIEFTRGRGGGARAHRGRGQLAHREHRRAAPRHHHRARARGSVVRGAEHGRRSALDRRRLRAPRAARDRRGPGPEPLRALAARSLEKDSASAPC